MKVQNRLLAFPLCSGPFAFCLLPFAFFLLVALSAFPGVASALPSYPEVRKAYVKSDSVLLDRRGEVIQELRTDLNRRRLDWAPLKNISPATKEAVIAAEDKRFYSHSGIDTQALGSALLKGLTSSGMRGASTLSMQLAALLDPDLQPLKGKRSIWHLHLQYSYGSAFLLSN